MFLFYFVDVLQSIWGITPVPDTPVDTPVAVPVEKREVEKDRLLYQPFIKPINHKRVFTVDRKPFNAPLLPTAPRAFMPVKVSTSTQYNTIPNTIHWSFLFISVVT